MNTMNRCAMGLVMGSCVCQSVGDEVTQLHKVMRDNPSSFEFLGTQVDVSGNVGIVGAHGVSTNGSFAGAAYLFDMSTGSLLHELLAADGNTEDVFGFTVAIDGSYAIIGSEQDDDQGFNSGSAYVFDVNTGMQMLKLLPDDGGVSNRFGGSVAVSGSIGVVGSPDDGDNGVGSGSAYVFDVSTGAQLWKLLPDDGQSNDEFGVSVAIDGNLIVVGAWQDDDMGSFSGGAYLFDATTGMQLSKILPIDGASGDLFGRFVGIDGTSVVVGAHGFGITGAAYLFDVSDQSNPIQSFKMIPPGGVSMGFGWGVDLSGTTIAIGAQQDTNHAGSFATGSVYLYDATTGDLLCKLVGDDSENNDNFGSSVAIDGGTLFAGARLNDEGGSNAGAAYVFEFGTGCPADLNGDWMLDFFDVSIFLTAFMAQDPLADFNGDGVFNFFDVSVFLTAFIAGCP